MKILLIAPPAPFLMNEKVNVPLGIMYLSSFLKKHNYEDTFIRHIASSKADAFNEKADVYAFSITTPQFPYAISLLKVCKRINPRALFIAGGVHPTARPNECFSYQGDNDLFDYVIRGEGEYALLYLLNCIESGCSPHSNIIDGMYMDNLASLPSPDFDGADIKSYTYYVGDRLATSLMTSRGCVWDCHFCASRTMWKSRIRENSVMNVRKEIKYLKDVYGYSAVVFQDDVFILKKDRIREIALYLKDEGFIWRCLIRGDETTTEEKLKIMKDNNCVYVGFGVESGSQAMLDLVNKRTTPEKNLQIVKLCKSVDLRIKAFFIIGLPGESHETMSDTIKWLEVAKKEGLDDVDCNIFYPYPGTVIGDNLGKYDIKLRDSNYEYSFMKGRPGEYRAVVETSHLTYEDIEKYRDRIYDMFADKTAQARQA